MTSDEISEEKTHRSEYRFEQLADAKSAIQMITEATELLASTFTVSVADASDEIPETLPGSTFKYSFFDFGELQDWRTRLLNKEDVILALVKIENRVMGYGIASKEIHEGYEVEHGYNINIIDVDAEFRRKNNSTVKTIINIEGQYFEVGIGHIIVKALLGKCTVPLRVDATNSMSRYIFKTFGFLHKKDLDSNPCILWKI